MTDNLFTWEFLYSYAGMVLAVSLIVQLLKGLIDKTLGKTATRRVVYVVSFIVVAIVVGTTKSFSGPLSGIVQTLFVGFMNSIAISFTAMKTYETILSKIPTLFVGKEGE